MPTCAVEPGAGSDGADSLTEGAAMKGSCGRLEIAAAGVMAPVEFDAAIYDLVNFLAYTAEPMKNTASAYGYVCTIIPNDFLRICLAVEP